MSVIDYNKLPSIHNPVHYLYVAYNKDSNISKIGITNSLERREKQLTGFRMENTYELKYYQAKHIETLVKRYFKPC
jgi:hypothetical protein